VSISNYYAYVRKWPIGLLALAALAAGCGSSGTSTSTAGRRDRAVDQSAARFAVRTQAQLKKGQFAAAWRTLHPAEKRVVSAQRLAACYPKNQFPGTVTFRATRTRDVTWLVPGTQDSVPAKEVAITVTSSTQPKQTFTQHLVRRGGGWAWMLSDHYFRAAKAGHC
jgi:hypothetical protein